MTAFSFRFKLDQLKQFYNNLKIENLFSAALKKNRCDHLTSFNFKL